jgi:carbonic anhydrase/acetyltransferase-like protein (isoleucine patch superfamily)
MFNVWVHSDTQEGDVIIAEGVLVGHRVAQSRQDCLAGDESTILRANQDIDNINFTATYVR